MRTEPRPKTRRPFARVSTCWPRGKRLGAVLLQFPFSFHHTKENLARLKGILKAFRDYPLVVEVRHSSWEIKEFYELLHDRGVGFCNIDQPVIGRSVKPTERTTAAIGYVRLHGRRYDTWFSDDPEMPSYERYNYLVLGTGARAVGRANPARFPPRETLHSSSLTIIIEAKSIVNALQLLHLLTGKK